MVVDKLMLLISLMNDVKNMLHVVEKNVQEYGVKAYIIGLSTEIEDLECFADGCRVGDVRILRDGRVERLIGSDWCRVNESYVEDVLTKYEEGIDRTIKSLMELRDLLSVLVATMKLVK
jgi:hypothetical protein